eukprot:7375897-Prymnesium_polylepis.1
MQARKHAQIAHRAHSDPAYQPRAAQTTPKAAGAAWSPPSALRRRRSTRHTGMTKQSDARSDRRMP